MSRTPSLITTLLASLYAALATDARAVDIYKCPNEDGSAHFQERPCEQKGPGAAVRVVAVVVEGATRDPAKIELMRASTAAVRLRLKDPYSARFSRVSIAEHSDGAMVACGLVNAKNSLGAYTGVQGFMFHSRDRRAVMDGDGKGFAAKFRGWCVLP